jgi:hypothetical protein
LRIAQSLPGLLAAGGFEQTVVAVTHDVTPVGPSRWE